jgi:transmembrane sensor
MTARADAPIAAEVVAQASHWLMLHWSGELDSQQRNAFAAWQEAHHEHRRAWQRLQQLQHSLAAVPADTTLAVMRDLPDRRRRQLLKLLGLMLMVGGSGLLAERQLPWREALADLRTGTGGPLERELPDGSRLQLNSGSAVNILFTARERRIRLLSGEVLITSGKDAGGTYRPLIVETPAGDVQALGTRFSVYEVDGGSRVQLYEGALEIRPRQASAVRLQAHQQLWFANDRCGPVGAADANAIAWVAGHLVAERTPLGQFLGELSRHRPGFLRCDPQVANLPLTGVFPLNDSDRVLHALEQALPIKVQRRTRYWVTVAPKG